MKKAKHICLIFLLSCSIMLLSSCATSERLDLASEETHKLCETYAKDVEWVLYSAYPSIRELESAMRSMKQHQDILLCSFKITAAEAVDSDEGAQDGDYKFKLTSVVKDVYIGNSFEKGKEFTQFVTQKDADASQLIGKEYVTFLQFDNTLQIDEYVPLYHYWTFLVNEERTLISPFGCLVEEDAQALEISLDSRNYTGQKLDYFVSVVKQLEAEINTETS